MPTRILLPQQYKKAPKRRTPYRGSPRSSRCSSRCKAERYAAGTPRPERTRSPPPSYSEGRTRDRNPYLCCVINSSLRWTRPYREGYAERVVSPVRHAVMRERTNCFLDHIGVQTPVLLGLGLGLVMAQGQGRGPWRYWPERSWKHSVQKGRGPLTHHNTSSVSVERWYLCGLSD